jgi:flavin reductase (DIM6/NTAB) family NADH-FMN oxidoreductase RutF
VDTTALRNALGCFATGVTVVTARSADGRLGGVTANSFSSVSLEPPLVLFSLHRRLRSLHVFDAAEHCAVNVLAAHQTDLSRRFAGQVVDRWTGVNCEQGIGGCPVLTQALAVFQCRRRERMDGGDHVIFLVEVLSMRWREECDPLVFYRSRYRELKEDRTLVHD